MQLYSFAYVKLKIFQRHAFVLNFILYTLQVNNQKKIHCYELATTQYNVPENGHNLFLLFSLIKRNFKACTIVVIILEHQAHWYALFQDFIK